MGREYREKSSEALANLSESSDLSDLSDLSDKVVYQAARTLWSSWDIQSSRSGNESFLTYFRFLPSHTTVRAVRHTAV